MLPYSKKQIFEKNIFLNFMDKIHFFNSKFCGSGAYFIFIQQAVI